MIEIWSIYVYCVRKLWSKEKYISNRPNVSIIAYLFTVKLNFETI